MESRGSDGQLRQGFSDEHRWNIPPAVLDKCDRRLAEHDADPSSALTWDEVEARIRTRIG